MIIDSHQHFWKYKPEKHYWINDEMASIRKDFLPSELKKIYNENKVDGCIAVQADQTIVETDFLIELAEQYSFIKGIVGWVDIQGKGLVEQLDHYSQFTRVKGFRHVVQGETDPMFMLRDDFLTGIAQFEKYNLTYDILIFPHQLVQCLELVKKFPNQKFVVDHLAKPYIANGYFQGWALVMKEIAKHENVYCKLSGMVTEADFRTWSKYQIFPYMEIVLEAFGAERLMFGSDWPVCLVAGTYATVKGLVTDFISQLSCDDQQAIMGTNAIQFYNLLDY